MQDNRRSAFIASVRVPHRRLLIAALLLLLPAMAAAQESTAETARRLGYALFVDQRFTNPAADYEASCSGCHAVGESVAGRSARVYADYTPQSLTATRGTTLRNTPTLIGVGGAERFGLDGAFSSLEELIAAKLTGELMGWEAGARTRARNAIHFTLLDERTAEGEPYAGLIQAAYGVELRATDGEQALELAVRALADFCRSLEPTQTAVWDAFRIQNRINAGPAEGEAAKRYAGGVEGRLGNLEGRLQIKRPEGFTHDAYAGFRIFFRTFGEASVGNCVACHVPPHFTDFAFHNTGITELEYDGVHGDGAFAKLEIADSSPRPRPELLRRPSRERPGEVDLGYWNHAPAGAELGAAIGAFKTPTLRDLGGTDPYMHNGTYPSLEAAVDAIVRVSQLARAGKLRAIDPEYLAMRLSEQDVAPLVAFLRQLDELAYERFRYYLIHLEED